MVLRELRADLVRIYIIYGGWSCDSARSFLSFVFLIFFFFFSSSSFFRLFLFFYFFIFFFLFFSFNDLFLFSSELAKKNPKCCDYSVYVCMCVCGRSWHTNARARVDDFNNATSWLPARRTVRRPCICSACHAAACSRSLTGPVPAAGPCSEIWRFSLL